MVIRDTSLSLFVILRAEDVFSSKMWVGEVQSVASSIDALTVVQGHLPIDVMASTHCTNAFISYSFTNMLFWFEDFLNIFELYVESK